MTEMYYLVKQNKDGVYLLSEPNKVLFSTKDRKEAEIAYRNVTGDKKVFPDEFKKGIYVLVSIGHYPLHPKTLYEIHSNTYPV